MTRLALTHPPTSVPEVVELLGHEFDTEFTRGAVTAVVSRLSANDAVSVPVLEHLARNALRALVGAGTAQSPEITCASTSPST